MIKIVKTTPIPLFKVGLCDMKMPHIKHSIDLLNQMKLQQNKRRKTFLKI